MLDCLGTDSRTHGCDKNREGTMAATGEAPYRQRKALVEPIIGMLKDQREMRRFRIRGLGKVAAEFALATTA